MRMEPPGMKSLPLQEEIKELASLSPPCEDKARRQLPTSEKEGSCQEPHHAGTR